MRKVGYLGPEGTFSHEALASHAGSDDLELVSLPTVYETVMAVHDGRVDQAFVPIENSLEGSVNATLDALAVETDDVAIVGEVVHPVRHCLIAREQMELEDIELVLSHPQANAQCARFIRTRLPDARVVAVNSTADAVRTVAESDDRAGCEVLRTDVEDVADNETRFVWLERGGPSGEQHGPFKTSIVYWGGDDMAPGWLVRCLSEFAFRGVNLTKIESRPRKQGLGRYMFFVDLEGRETDQHVSEALEGLRNHAETLKVLGSYPAA